jgi:hypothetical protein
MENEEVLTKKKEKRLDGNQGRTPTKIVLIFYISSKLM